MPAQTTIARVLGGVAIAAAGVALAAHAGLAFGGGYLNYVSGIWLALARDLDHGLFYRDLIGDAGYGGTRYFPLFFVIIAFFMKVGAGVLAAGWMASAVSAVVLVSGMYCLVRWLGAGRLTAAVFAAASIAPYFVQQTLFEVRADVLAAALNVWGLAFLLPEWGAGSRNRANSTWSAVCFTLAMAAKVTSLAIPIATLGAIFLAGRRSSAWNVAWRLIAGVLVFFAGAWLLSNGRAIDSWRACMFAGTDSSGTLTALLNGDFIQLTRYSRLLSVLFAAATGSVITALWLSRESADPHTRRNWIILAGLFAGSSASAAAALSSPGTVASNQMVEWIEIALVVVAFVACTQTRVTSFLTVFACALAIWASAQDVRTTMNQWNTRLKSVDSAEVQALVERVAAAPGPVLAENALWPVLAGTRVAMLDPFALRVVMQSRPDIDRDLADKIDRQIFPLVIFQVDPTTPVGRGYYEHVNFGWPTTRRILDRYDFAGHPRPDVYIYVPKPAGGRSTNAQDLAGSRVLHVGRPQQ